MILIVITCSYQLFDDSNNDNTILIYHVFKNNELICASNIYFLDNILFM